MTTGALVLFVIFINLLVDVLALIAVIGLMVDEKAMAEEKANPEKHFETTTEPLGLLLDRKE